MLPLLDAAALRRWAEVCVQELTTHCAEINALNVFPVADADTGTNLLHTMRAGLDGLLLAPAELGGSQPAAAAALARGALVGARGNSGVILSQVLRGLADVPGAHPGLDAERLRLALWRADELACAAISDPVDGTILTVLHAAANAAHGSTLDAVSTAAACGAADALRQTPGQLDVLGKAGVVDAGGRGLVVLLDALVMVITGTALAPRPHTVTARPLTVLTAEREGGSAQQTYEVRYLLDHTSDQRMQTLRAQLNGIGDSVIIVDDGNGLYSVHTHPNDIGAAVESGVIAGWSTRVACPRTSCYSEWSERWCN